MSLKIAFYFLLALSSGLALANEEPEAVLYELANDGAEEQEVFVASDFFNDPSSSVKDEVSDQADDEDEDEEAPATDTEDKRKVVFSTVPIDWNTAKIYPVAASGARADSRPSTIPTYPLLSPIPNYGHPSFPRYPPPFGYPYPHYPYPYYGLPFPPPPQHYPYPGQVYSHSHSTSKPTPTTSRPSREKRKHCKEIFPIGRICAVEV